MRTPFFQFDFGFAVFTMRLVLLSTIYIFTDVESVSVCFFILRFICLSFSHFDSLLCSWHLTTFYRYFPNAADSNGCVCVCLRLPCISVFVLTFKRVIRHLFTSTPINFIYFFASFFFLFLLLFVPSLSVFFSVTFHSYLRSFNSTFFQPFDTFWLLALWFLRMENGLKTFVNTK